MDGLPKNIDLRHSLGETTEIILPSKLLNFFIINFLRQEFFDLRFSNFHFLRFWNFRFSNFAIFDLSIFDFEKFDFVILISGQRVGMCRKICWHTSEAEPGGHFILADST